MVSLQYAAAILAATSVVASASTKKKTVDAAAAMKRRAQLRRGGEGGFRSDSAAARSLQDAVDAPTASPVALFNETDADAGTSTTEAAATTTEAAATTEDPGTTTTTTPVTDMFSTTGASATTPPMADMEGTTDESATTMTMMDDATTDAAVGTTTAAALETTAGGDTTAAAAAAALETTAAAATTDAAATNTPADLDATTAAAATTATGSTDSDNFDTTGSTGASDTTTGSTGAGTSATGTTGTSTTGSTGTSGSAAGLADIATTTTIGTSGYAAASTTSGTASPDDDADADVGELLPEPGCHTCHEGGETSICLHNPGQLFAHCGSGGYIQCGTGGYCVELPCPPGTVFSETYQTCVHDCVLPDECTNPCTPSNVAAGDWYWPLCTDTKKFVQCDAFGGCFVKSCAPGAIWSEERGRCVTSGGSSSSSPPSCHLPSACAEENACDNYGADTTTKYALCTDTYQYYTCTGDGGCVVESCKGTGVVFDPVAQDCVEPAVCDLPDDCDNPCTEENIGESGNYFQPHCDADKYIECTMAGGCIVNECEFGKVWNVEVRACTYGGETMPPKTAEQCDEDECGGSPCTEEAIDEGLYFFDDCVDEARFRQCDAWGVCYALDCPPGTAWDALELSCA